MNLGKELEKGWLRYFRPLAKSVLMESVTTYIMSGGEKHAVELPRIARDKMREMASDKLGLKEEIKKLKEVIAQQEYKIESLEVQLAEKGFPVKNELPIDEVF